MKECLEEGGLRAYLDRELPPDEMTRIAVHVGGCAECHARYNELAGRAARVAALMVSLEVGPVVSHTAPATKWILPRPRPVATAVLALAATAALAFVLLPRHTEAPKPVAAPRSAPVRQAIEQAASPVVKPPELSPNASDRPVVMMMMTAMILATGP